MGHRVEEFVPRPGIEVGCFNIALSLVVTVSYKGDSMVSIKWMPIEFCLSQVSGNSRSIRFYSGNWCCPNFLVWWGKISKIDAKPSVALLESLRSCWREEVLIHCSFDKFFFLSLQLLSKLWSFKSMFFFCLFFCPGCLHLATYFLCHRYVSWLSSGLVARKASNAGPIPGTE